MSSSSRQPDLVNAAPGELSLGFGQAVIRFVALDLNIWHWMCRMGIGGMNVGKEMEGRCVHALPVVSFSLVWQRRW